MTGTKKIQEAYNFLRAGGYTVSQEDFSCRYMRMSPRYMSMLKASPSRKPSLDAVASLAATLEGLGRNLVLTSLPDVQKRGAAAIQLASELWEELRWHSLCRERLHRAHDR